MSTNTSVILTSPSTVYSARRARLARQLSRPLVICAGHAPARNYANNTHVFRAGSSYLYFGGPPLEHAALLIEPGSDGHKGCTLLRLRCGPEDAVWFGPLPGDADLCAAAGLPPTAVGTPDDLPKLLGGRAAAAIAPPFPDTLAWVARLGLHAPTADESRAIVDLRLVKDEHELAAMRRAGEISVAAHLALRAAIAPGRREAELAAAFLGVLTAHESQPSFTPIITVRGEVLHGAGYPHTLKVGDLLLCDAAGEEPRGYASDITRTYPVSGSFTSMQRQLYETVVRALKAATAACVAGRRYRDVHDLAARVICEGLVQAGLLRGNADELVARHAHALFFTHGVGHLIGLDVHDMEDFGDLAGYASGRTRRKEFGSKFLRLDRDLLPGMCVTIEPGIYLVPEVWACAELTRGLEDVVQRPAVDALLKARFGGIRVENTICVRSAGEPEVLTPGLAVEADEVAAAVGH